MGGLNVQERAECLGTFRWIAARMMRQLAEWIPTTPEMEVKVLFGRHVWECARHADAFGRRAFELRAPLHYTLAPTPAYLEWMDAVGAAASAADRVAVVYDAVLPGLRERYAGYIAATDALMDEPTVRILESVQADLERMGRDRARLLQGVALPRPSLDVDALRDREARLAAIVEHGGQEGRARGVRA
jgi:hypothetical protein